MSRTVMFILTILLFAYFNVQAAITGTWLMVKTQTDTDIDEPYIITQFKSDGHFNIMNIPFGGLDYIILELEIIQ